MSRNARKTMAHQVPKISLRILNKRTSMVGSPATSPIHVSRATTNCRTGRESTYDCSTPSVLRPEPLQQDLLLVTSTPTSSSQVVPAVSNAWLKRALLADTLATSAEFDAKLQDAQLLLRLQTRLRFTYNRLFLAGPRSCGSTRVEEQ